MQSRRVFLKNGAFALVSLGFAPSFLARTAYAAGGRAKQLIAIFQRGAVDGLNMVVPHGEVRLLPRAADIAIPRPNADDGALDLDGFFGFNPRLALAQADLGSPGARRRARVRVAGRHPVALRRAGLHGIGHARRQEHRGGLAEPVSPGRRDRGGHGVFARSRSPSASAHVAGHRVGTRHEPDRAVRHPRWAAATR